MGYLSAERALGLTFGADNERLQTVMQMNPRYEACADGKAVISPISQEFSLDDILNAARPVVTGNTDVQSRTFKR